MKHRHLSLEDREFIEEYLSKGFNFTQIGSSIKKHRTTISNEILNHRFRKEKNIYNTSFVNCSLENSCKDFQGVACKKKCSKYKEKLCPSLIKSPYVCNGCSKKNVCRSLKYYYRGREAHREYKLFLSEARDGIRISKDEIYEINNIIAPLIKEKNQSINHVYINHPDLLYFSKPTFYSYVDKNLFSFRNTDLLRKVKYKPRKSTHKRRTRTEAAVRQGRTYEDFKEYISKHPKASIVEMDTVEGVKGGKVFLTLLFRNYNFMLIFLMENKTMDCVEECFIYIKKTLGLEVFKKLFEVILTDNGSEFFNPISIEVDLNLGELLSHVFYCDPGASWQKGSLEKNHEYIRYVLPKGTTFDNLTQNDCDKLSSNINSTCRESLNGNSPFDAIKLLIDSETINKLNIHKVEPDDVNLSPKLLKK